MGGLSKILGFLCSLNQDHIRKENLMNKMVENGLQTR